MNVLEARECHVYIRVFSKGVHNTRDLGTYRLSTLAPLQYTRSFCVCAFLDAVIALIEYRFSLGTNLK